MNILLLIAGLILAYFIGSIPTAVWFGKLYHGIDVVKGLCAASIPVVLMWWHAVPEKELVTFKLIFGIVAVLGHLFSAFIKFKGGKGVATLLGMMLAIHYEAALVCVLIFVVLLVTTKYVSLSSILGALSFPFLLLIVPRFRGGEPLLIIFGFILFLILLWTHNKNLQRIRRGEESKTYLFHRKHNSD